MITNEQIASIQSLGNLALSDQSSGFTEIFAWLESLTGSALPEITLKGGIEEVRDRNDQIRARILGLSCNLVSGSTHVVAGPITISELNLSLSGYLGNSAGEHELSFNVIGEFDITGIGPVSLIANLPTGDTSSLKLSAHFGAGLSITDGIASLATLLGGDDIATQINGIMDDLPDLRITTINLEFNRDTGFSLESLSVGLSLEESYRWEAIPDVISVGNIHLSLSVYKPFSSAERLVNININGNVELFNYQTHFTLSLPDGFFSGRLSQQSPIPLRQLINEQLDLPDLEVPDLSVVDLSVKADRQTAALGFSITVQGEWAIFEQLVLKRISFNVQRLSGSTSGRLSAQLYFAGLDFTVQAGYDSSSRGMDFSAMAMIDPIEGMPLNTLFANIADAFNADIQTPDALSEFSITDMGASFSSNSNGRSLSFFFAGTTGLELGAFALNRISVELTVLRTTDTTTVSGSVAAQLALAGVQAELSAELSDALSFTANIPELQVQSFCKNLLDLDLPPEIPDILFENLAFSATPANRTFSLSGEVTTDGLQLNAGAASLNIEKAVLSVSNDGTGTAFFVQVIGSGQINDDIRFESFDLTFGYDRANGGWLAEGTVVCKFFDQAFTLAASYLDQNLALSYDSATPITLLDIPDIGSVSVSRIAFTLQRREDGTTGFEFASAGRLSIPDVVNMDGELTFRHDSAESRFSFVPSSEGAMLTVPVFPLSDDKDLEFIFEFGPLEISRSTVDNSSQWGFEAAVEFSCPQLHELQAQLPAEVREVLTLPEKITAHFTALNGTIAITLEEPLIDTGVIDIPEIELAGTKISIGKTRIRLSNLFIALGREFGLYADLGLGLPNGLLDSEIFKTFDPANPEETLTQLKLEVSRAGLKLKFLTSPLSCITFEEPDENGKVWCTIDLNEYGALRFQVPEFALDLKARSLVFSGGVEVKRELKLPLFTIKKMLEGMNMEALAEALPAGIPIKSVNLLDNGALDVNEFANVYQDTMGVALPNELRDVLEGVAEGVDRLPDDFKKYLGISIPDSFSIDLSINPASMAVSVKMSVGEDSDPIRLILPQLAPLPQLIGIEFYSLTFGTLYGSSLFQLAVDARIDQFFLGTLAAAIALGTDHALPLPVSTELHRRYIIDNLFALVVVTPVGPIPIPLFYDELGVEYCGLEGVQAQAHIRFPMPELDIGALFSTLSDLPKFVREPAFRLDPRALGEADLRLEVGPSYFQLPEYFGSDYLGSKESKELPGVYETIANLMNALKFTSLTEIIQLIPFENRMSFSELQFYGLKLQANWLLATLEEFNQNREQISRQIAANAEELVDLLPAPVEGKTSGEGLVTFIQGGFEIGTVARFESTFALAMVQGESFATGFRFKGVLADLFSLDVTGAIQVRSNESPAFSLGGTASMTFLNKEVLSGTVAVDSARGLHITGMMDLFPDDSALQIKGEVDGWVTNDDFEFTGNVSVRIFDTITLVGGFLKINTEQISIKGEFMGQTIKLALERKGNALRFFALMSPIELSGELFAFTGKSTEGGPIFYLELGDRTYQSPDLRVAPVVDMKPAPSNEWAKKTEGDMGWQVVAGDDNWMAPDAAPPVASATLLEPDEPNPMIWINHYEDWTPSGDALRLYLSAELSLLGMHSSTEVLITDEGLFFEVTGKLWSVFEASLQIQVTDLGSTEASYSFTGSVEAFGGIFDAAGSLTMGEQGPQGSLSLTAQSAKQITLGGFTLDIPNVDSEFRIDFAGLEFDINLRAMLSLGNIFQNVGVTGKLNSDLHGSLTLGVEKIQAGSMELSGAFTLFKNARGVGVKAENLSAKIGNISELKVEQFSIESSGKLEIEVEGTTLLNVPPALVILGPSIDLKYDPNSSLSANTTPSVQTAGSMTEEQKKLLANQGETAGLQLAVGVTTVKIPWLDVVIKIPGFEIETPGSKTQGNPFMAPISDLISLYGTPVLGTNEAGDFQLEIKEAGLKMLGQDVIRINDFTIGSDGHFNADASFNGTMGFGDYKIGGSSNIQVSYSKQNDFKLRISNSKLYLPVIGAINLPELNINMKDKFVCDVNLQALKLGPFTVDSATYQLEIGADYFCFQLKLSKTEDFRIPGMMITVTKSVGQPSASVTIAGSSNTVTLDEFKVDSRSGFCGRLRGELTLMGQKISCCSYSMKLANNRLEFTGRSYTHVGGLYLGISGWLRSDSQFRFSGSASIHKEMWLSIHRIKFKANAELIIRNGSISATGQGELQDRYWVWVGNLWNGHRDYRWRPSSPVRVSYSIDTSKREVSVNTSFGQARFSI